MEFLHEINDRGYPVDYLLARIHGRRPFLLSDWESALMSPDVSEYLASIHYREFMTTRPSEGIWRLFYKESAWVYYQMNDGLRNIFKPYYMYSELNTLLICLRYKTGKGNNQEIERLLEFSLISEKIKDLLKIDSDVPSALSLLEKVPPFIPRKLSGAYLRDGLKGAEQEMAGALLEYIINSDLHTIMDCFFTSVINSRNIITLHKRLRWEITSVPLFIDGGSIKKSVLEKLADSYKTEEYAGLVYKHTGQRLEGPDAAGVENALQNSLAAKLRKWERESPDIGLILNYLCRCAAEAKNLSVIYHGRAIDKGILKKELVL